DDLTNAGRHVSAEDPTKLRRGADGAAQRAEPLLHEPGGQRLPLPGGDAAVETEGLTAFLKLVPDAGPAGPVLAVDVVVTERVAEEMAPVQAALDGGRL